MIGERALRAILAFIAVYHIVTGLLALLAPDTFFDQIGHYGSRTRTTSATSAPSCWPSGSRSGSPSSAPPGGRRCSGWERSGTRSMRSTTPSTPAKRRARARGWTDTMLLAFGAVGAAWLARVCERLRVKRGRGA